MAGKKKQAPRGASLIPGLSKAMSGAGPRRDKVLLDAELKALGLSEPTLKPKKKTKKR